MGGDGWEAVTWAGARRAQRRDQAAVSPARRLRWLEDALRLAAAARHAPAATALPHEERRRGDGEVARREAAPTPPGAPRDQPPDAGAS